MSRECMFRISALTVNRDGLRRQLSVSIGLRTCSGDIPGNLASKSPLNPLVTNESNFKV